MATDNVALTIQFNKASRKIHNVSNSLINMKLVALFSDIVLYGKALACFYHVFAALEGALDEALKHDNPDVVKFKEPLTGGLYRAAGFREDLEYFLGKDWETQCGSKSTELREYEHHLTLLATTQPRLLLSHAYTQHLAAASGGQIIKRFARKHLKLPEDKGTSAFDYKGESNNTLRSKFKSQLDDWGSGLEEEEVQQLISEHLAAFQYNNGIIRAFPISLGAMAKGLLRITPRPLLLALLAVVALLLALVVPWVVAMLRQAPA